MTYIEKPEYYYSNRVLVVKSIGVNIVTGIWINLETGRHTPARIGREKFQERYELSEIQIK